MKFAVYVNYYLAGGVMPSWQHESIACLIASIQTAIHNGIHVNAIVRVSSLDITFF